MTHEHWKHGPRVLRFVGFGVLGAVLAGLMGLIFGALVMWLWNWLMPVLFGLPTVTFWQAWGLVLLSHILFKSFPHGSPHDHHHREWKKHLVRHLDRGTTGQNRESEGFPET